MTVQRGYEMKTLLNDTLAFVNPILILAFAFIIVGIIWMIFVDMPLGAIEIIIGIILVLVFMFLEKNNGSSG